MATRKIFNQGANNKMTYIENQAKNDVTVYEDLVILNLKNKFNTDEQLVEHLASILNLPICIKKEED